MNTYIGIPTNEKDAWIIANLQKKIPNDFEVSQPPFHLTIDYLGEEKMRKYGENLLTQFHEKYKNLLHTTLVFDHTFSFANKYDTEEIIFALGLQKEYRKRAEEIYEAMNIPQLSSQSPANLWIPHITIAKGSRHLPEEKLQENIILPIKNITIL